MINPSEFRLGNYLMQKIHNRIISQACSYLHFELMSKDEVKDLFPIVMKAELLENLGFKENMDYPLRPDAREFIMVLPVQGSQQNQLRVYIKNNKECFGRAMINGLPASNSFYHLHQLQNLYFSLTGEELPVKL